jgi:phospho-N-acetylmuramoyl-pentapeptide-transferase
MLYLLYQALREWIHGSTLFGGLAVLQWVEFRAVAACVLAFALVVALGRRTIHWLLKLKIGDNPEFYHKDLNELMKQKANTPTMGGVLISGAILLTVLLLADMGNFYVHMALVCLIWLLIVGVADDYLKLTSARRKPGSREGLYTGEKLLLQIGLAVILGLFLHSHGVTKESIDVEGTLQMSHALNLPFLKTWTRLGNDYTVAESLVTLSRPTFVLVAILFIVGFSNAVNLTDGMDGLAAGTMTIVAFAFAVLAIIAGYHYQGFELAKYLLVPFIKGADELAIIAGAMTGACLGFLWFNANPAQVFMGDSGSLPLGGLIGFIAVAIRQEFLLLIIGGIFLLEAVSVVLQVGYFKASRGKRIFRCAPIHHHFHLGGWTEQQVVVRFWVLTGVLVAIALATIKIR